jgi:protein-disulfide isomerase
MTLLRTVRGAWPILLAGFAGLVSGSIATRAAAGDPQDRGAIEAIVRDYILKHPEIIPEAMDRLRDQQTAKAIGASRAALETPFGGAWAGNPKGDVTLVMFTDYSCGFCKASAPDIDTLLASDPKLKVVWREIPVLGPRSETAARVALAVARRGANYPAFHRALFAAQAPDTPALAKAARTAGADPATMAREAGAPEIAREIDANLALAGRLGVSGTPAFVVGNRMLSGAVGHDVLKQAIEAARKG